jgi:hypothetical protein
MMGLLNTEGGPVEVSKRIFATGTDVLRIDSKLTNPYRGSRGLG